MELDPPLEGEPLKVTVTWASIRIEGLEKDKSHILNEDKNYIVKINRNLLDAYPFISI